MQTNDFRNALAQAKDLVANLPGGELLIDDQDEVIRMLETLRDRKKCVRLADVLTLYLLTQSTRAQLERFSRQPLQASATSTAEEKMEVDSMASTPAND